MAAETENAFKTLLSKTYCPFASKAKIIYSPDWNANKSFTENIAQIVPNFVRFEEIAESEELDMYVMGIKDLHAVGTIESAAKSLKSILETLRLHDEANKEPLVEGIETLEWNFKFRKTDFFVPFFGPYYNQNNPRYSYTPDYGFIVFQPDHSFSRHHISSKNPNRYRISQAIRDAFIRGNTPYDMNLVVGTPKAIRYIKPENIGEPICEWWVD